ncbi:D-amino-acid transaminase [Lederbergia lenta]|uniref:D-alanine aminotransferase n=1 Tax=Lederbergia lenta TaxID=1467 RepID=A0A2X4WEM7_LEDLE|nr:D-amino-acid transaminase [Lederbergia lenta]MEC2326465.1 D-amino-acid transaminase [Lederbergia lenta]SQI61219.1 D-amino acid aminotransferase [Lederbergia lenta]
MVKIIYNDQIMDKNKVQIDIEDRGYQFGDGVYEVIRIYDGQLFTAEEHLTRFFSSAEKIKIVVPFPKEQLLRLIKQLINENKVNNGSIYMQITRGASPRNHVFPSAETKPVLTAYTKVVERPESALENGVEAIVADDIRWLRCDIKSLNLLPNLLAKQQATEKGCYESILHRDGTVTEGSSSNAYIIKDGKVKTHPATNLILNGITRQVIARLCDENQIPFYEEVFTVDELLAADEVFISSTTSEVMPVIRVDGKLFSDGKPGQITRKLQSLFLEEIKKMEK